MVRRMQVRVVRVETLRGRVKPEQERERQGEEAAQVFASRRTLVVAPMHVARYPRIVMRVCYQS